MFSTRELARSVRPGETEYGVGERLDGFAGEPLAADLRRENVAELDVPYRGQCRAKEAYCLTRAAFWVSAGRVPSAGVAGARLHKETLRFAWRIGMPESTRSSARLAPSSRNSPLPGAPKCAASAAKAALFRYGRCRWWSVSGTCGLRPSCEVLMGNSRVGFPPSFQNPLGFPELPPNFRSGSRVRENQVHRVHGSRWKFSASTLNPRPSSWCWFNGERCVHRLWSGMRLFLQLRHITCDPSRSRLRARCHECRADEQ